MLLKLLCALQLATPQAPAPRVYNGRAGEIVVQAPRLEADITVDGSLSEAVWKQAAVLTGFSEYQPVDGQPAPDSTAVLVWYDAHAIYFGIRAFEPHGAVHATLADRDRIDGDDNLQLLLDTFDAGRRALVFGVNPLGVQSDGIRSEGGNPGGPGQNQDFSGTDLNPDFIYDSKGHVEPWGFEVEIRIPFKSLRFQSGHVQTWGLNIIRNVQHSGYQETWTPARKASASFLAQSGKLEGLTDLRRGLVLDVNPVVTERVTGAPAESPPIPPGGAPAGAAGWEYTPGRLQPGGNVRWGVTPNLALTGTVNPDFSQVEADAGQIVTDPRDALFFPEKRPFFLEGIEQFQTPNTLIYTRRIVNPLTAAKLTGKVGGTDVGLLSAVDDPNGDGSTHPVYNILRLRRDLGAQSTAGLAYTDRVAGADYNRVAELDTRIVFGKLYFFEAQAAGSFTRSAGATTTAPLWEAVVDRTGRSFGFHYSLQGVDSAFDAGAGFLTRTGVVNATVMNRYSYYGGRGALLENYTVFFHTSGRWDYPLFFDGRVPNDFGTTASNSFTLRGGWKLGLNASVQSLRFPPTFYEDYYVAVPGAAAGTDTVPFVGRNRLTDLGLGGSVSTPQFHTFAASLSLTGSRDTDFDEWAQGYVLNANGSLDLRPSDRLRVSTSYLHRRVIRPSDFTTVLLQRIPRLKVEYQLSRPIFFRFVGQYTSTWRDALRDEAGTGGPILLRIAPGVFAPTTIESANGFRADWLFSYQPNPGTVIFAGYGGSLAADAYTLRGLQRTEDGFFFKLSYLFRL